MNVINLLIIISIERKRAERKKVFVVFTYGKYFLYCRIATKSSKDDRTDATKFAHELLSVAIFFRNAGAINTDWKIFEMRVFYGEIDNEAHRARAAIHRQKHIFQEVIWKHFLEQNQEYWVWNDV